MQKIASLIIASICVLTLSSSAFAEVHYKNSSIDYAITLPDNWIEIPKETIDTYMQQVAAQSGAPFINFTAGFQQTGFYFTYPYMLVQEHPGLAPSLDEIAKNFTKENVFDSPELKDQFKDLLTVKTLDGSHINREKNYFVTTTDLDVANVGSVKALIAMFPTNNGLLQLNFYSLAENYPELSTLFMTAVDSVDISPKVQSLLSNRTFRSALIGGGIGLIIGLVVHFFKRKKNA